MEKKNEILDVSIRFSLDIIKYTGLSIAESLSLQISL